MNKRIPLFIISSLLFFCGKGYAQFNPVWNAGYQHTSSLGFSNESRKVTVDAAGNVFVLADATSDIDPFGIVTGSTYHYTVVQKYSSTGTLLFEQAIWVNNHVASGFDNKGAFGLELDAAGNVYTGYNYYDPFNDYDVRLTKFDNNLNEEWTIKYNPTTIDYGVAMSVTPSGTVYAIAQSISGPNSEYHILKSDIVNFDLGSLYSFSIDIDILSSLVLDASENIYVTGYSLIAGYKNVLTASIDDSGILRWKRNFNGGSISRDDLGRNLTIGVDGYLYVTGASDRGAPWGYDILLFKYDTYNGKNPWVKFYDYNNGSDQGYFVLAPELDYVYIGSVSTNTVLIDRIETYSGNRNGRAVYQPLPVTPYSALNSAVLTGMQISPNMNFYITGNILGTELSGQAFSAAYLARYILSSDGRGSFKLDFEIPVYGDFNQSFTATGLALDNVNEDVYWLSDTYETYASHQIEEVLLTNFDVPSPFKLENNVTTVANTDGILIYPVSGNNFISVTSSIPIAKIELFDLSGKKVKTVSIQSQHAQIDIAHLVSGVYIGRVVTMQGEVISRKIIKN